MDTNLRTTRGRAARMLALGPVRRLVAVAAVGCLVAAGAQGQQPQRAAALLPPRPLEPGELPPVARGAVEDGPAPASTPVTRPRAQPAGPITGSRPTPSGPAWLTGEDPNLQPAGYVPARQPGRVVTAASPPARALPAREEPSMLARGLDRVKGLMTRNEPVVVPPAGGAATSPAAPIRGTDANGAPVYAGPPAYRWYGYGTVTPGANPLAPTGQYPKASANWYAQTGATPGAVPVPVVNPLRPPPGSDPPAYLPGAAAARTPGPAPSAPAVSRPLIPPTTPVGAGPATATGSKFDTPTRPQAPRPPAAATPGVPAPVGVPVLAAPPGPKSVASEPPVLHAAPLPPVPPAGPIAVAPVRPPDQDPRGSKPAAPAPFPAAAATPNDINWQPTGETTPPPPGTWVPAGSTPRTAPRPAAGVNWESKADRPHPVARGQAADTDRTDAAALVRSLCHGRAKDLDVRQAGSQALTVCFEVPTEVEAGRLVKEVCARPELAPYQIDFCVLVK